MSEASLDVMRRAGVTMDDIALVVPHQANLRIIDAVAKRAGAGAGQAVFDGAEIRQHERGHGAGGAGRGGGGRPRAARRPGADAGVRRRTDPVGASDSLGRAHHAAASPAMRELPPCPKTALELVNEIRAQKKLGEAEASRFETLELRGRSRRLNARGRIIPERGDRTAKSAGYLAAPILRPVQASPPRAPLRRARHSARETPAAIEPGARSTTRCRRTRCRRGPASRRRHRAESESACGSAICPAAGRIQVAIRIVSPKMAGRR